MLTTGSCEQKDSGMTTTIVVVDGADGLTPDMLRVVRPRTLNDVTVEEWTASSLRYYRQTRNQAAPAPRLCPPEPYNITRPW